MINTCMIYDKHVVTLACLRINHLSMNQKNHIQVDFPKELNNFAANRYLIPAERLYKVHPLFP